MQAAYVLFLFREVGTLTDRKALERPLRSQQVARRVQPHDAYDL